jgi:hypothetical protein
LWGLFCFSIRFNGNGLLRAETPLSFAAGAACTFRSENARGGFYFVCVAALPIVFLAVFDRVVMSVLTGASPAKICSNAAISAISLSSLLTA